MFYLKSLTAVASFQVVKSVRPSHYWIEFDGAVVDITLDQFDQKWTPIIGSQSPHPFDKLGNVEYLTAIDFLHCDESMYRSAQIRFDKLFSTF